MTGEPLPRGTVAFAFTDVEGSTALLRTLGDAWAPLLRTSLDLLREAVDAAGGVVVDVEGDGAFLAFPDVRAAVHGLVAAQQALLAHPWPEGAHVRVRAGVHAGHAEPVDGRYVALAVHEAARIGALAHGGQVVLSEQAVLLLGGALPDGVVLRDRGRFDVRDFPLPVRVYDVTAPGLPPVERGLRAVPADGGNLPPATAPLHGREDVLATLAEPAPLTTLAGPPGVGKTAAALASARTVRPRDGVWLVPLEPLPAIRSLAEAVLSALGLPVGGGLEPVGAQLADREVLLLLDGADDRRDEVAELATSLALRAPRVRLLVTARSPLLVAGERVVRLEPLPVPANGAVAQEVLASPSVRLLLSGAAQRWDAAQHADALAGLARRTDGLPLALELVGARLGALAPADLLPRVDAQLARAGRTGALRLALDSAWSSLPEPARRLWERLSVFSGPVDLDAVEQVCSDSDDAPGDLPVDEVVDALAVLVGSSVVLLEQDAEGGAAYRLLRSVRQYGEERLLPGSVAALRDRHAAWAAHAVEGWLHRATVEPPPGPLRALAAAQDDVLVGLAHLGAQHPDRVVPLVPPLRRHLRESLDLVDLLAFTERLPEARDRDAVLGLLRAQLSWERAPGPETVALFEAAVAGARGASAAVRADLLAQATMVREQFQLPPDQEWLAALQQAAAEADDPGLLVRATAMQRVADPAEDEALRDRAVELARTRAPGLLGWATGRRLHLWSGRRPEQARADVEDLLLRLPSTGASESTTALLVCALVLMALGEPEQVGRLAAQAATAAARRRNVVIGFHAAVLRAAAAGAVGAPEAPALLAAVDAAVSSGPFSDPAMAGYAHGWVLAGSDPEAARAWSRTALLEDPVIGWQLRALAAAVHDPDWHPRQGLLGHVPPT